MRLWHYQIIRFLPRLQLLAQWRELNLIFRKEPKHILINYIYEDQYQDKKDLLAYSNLVVVEMKSRGYRLNLDTYHAYFGGLTSDVERPFEKYQDDDYLLICFYNLKEKYRRGQKDFTDTQFKALESSVSL